MKKTTFHDVEQISALLDGKLSQAESTKLESRLRADPSLRSLREELSQTRALLRRIPKRKAPRNFTLTPRTAGVKPPIPRAFPALRFATVLATFLLVFSVATNTFAPAFSTEGAQAPAYGMGGGGAEGPSVMSAPATEAPALAQTAPGAEALPTVAATAAADSSRIADTPTPEASLKGFAPEQPVPQPESQSQRMPVSNSLIIVLLVIAMVSGGLAWLLRWTSERSWRAKTK